MEQTVQKALNLLEALVRSGQPRRLTELSRQLGLTKPNVYRLLSTLSVLGYVKKDPANSLYSPTLKLWEMGSLLVRDVDLVSVAGPRLRRLMDETHESVQLAVFDAGNGVTPAGATAGRLARPVMVAARSVKYRSPVSPPVAGRSR